MQGGVTGKGFLPGQSGNPNGRPKTKPLTSRYAAVLESELPNDIRKSKRLPKGATFGDAIAIKNEALLGEKIGKATPESGPLAGIYPVAL